MKKGRNIELRPFRIAKLQAPYSMSPQKFPVTA